MSTAHVAAINWTDGTVDLFANGRIISDVPWTGKYPPAPGSRVEVRPSGASAGYGPRRLVFHDDFLHVASIGFIPRYGDTPWIFPTAGNQGTAISIGTTTDAVGAMRLETNDGNTTIGITKTDQSPVDGLAYWLSGRVRSQAYNNNEVTFAFRTTVGGDLAGIYMSEPLNAVTAWLIAAQKDGGGFAQEFEGSDAVSDTWQMLEVLFVPGAGGFVAGWIDGNGPGVRTTNVPDSADSVAPTFMVVARAVPAARQAEIDWMRLEVYQPDLPVIDVLGAAA